MLFDTRYFWTIFTATDNENAKALRAIFDRSKAAYVSSLTIYEVYKLTLAHEDGTVAELRAGTIEKEFTIVDVDPEIAREGAKIGHMLKVPMADALIMATSKRLRVPCVTDDPHFTEVKRVWI